MNAPLRVPTSTRTPLIARSFHVVSRSGRVLPPPRSRGEEYQLPNLALALPPRPVLLVQADERPRRCDHLGRGPLVFGRFDYRKESHCLPRRVVEERNRHSRQRLGVEDPVMRQPRENGEPRLRAPRTIPSSVSLAAAQQAEQLYGVGRGNMSASPATISVVALMP